MKLEWRPVLGYEGFYEVSSDGQVRSVTRQVPYGRHGCTIYKGRPLKTFSSKNGYKCVKLALRCNTKTAYVHELVLRAFVGPRPVIEERSEIRHLDGNKNNNSLANLKYGTIKENAEDRKRHLLQKLKGVKK